MNAGLVKAKIATAGNERSRY